jgi:hypothetical protein
MPTAHELERTGFASAELPHERRIEPLSSLEVEQIPSWQEHTLRAQLAATLRQVKMRLRVHAKHLQFRVPPDFERDLILEVSGLLPLTKYRNASGETVFMGVLVVSDDELTDTIVVERRP